MELKIGVFADEVVIDILKRIAIAIARMLKFRYMTYKLALPTCEVPINIFTFSTAYLPQSASIFPLDLLAIGRWLSLEYCLDTWRGFMGRSIIIVPSKMRAEADVISAKHLRVIAFEKYPEELVAYILLFISSVLGLKRSFIIRSLKSMNLHNVSGLIETLKQVSVSERFKRS